jgi:hypothetical protein
VLHCQKIVFLTKRFLDVATFIILIPFSLLFSNKLSFPTVSLKKSSLPTLTLKSEGPKKPPVTRTNDTLWTN